MDNKNLKLALCVGIPAAIVAAVVVIFCLNLGGGSKGYMKVSPSSSVVVAKGNIGAVLQKSEVLENEKVSQLFNSAMEYVPEEYQDIINDIYADPNKSGINVNEPAVFAVSSVEPLSGVMVMAMNSIDDFENLLNTFAEDYIEIDQNNGVNVIELNRKIAVAYDSEKLVVAFVDSRDQEVDVMSYFELEADEMAVNAPEFNEFFNCQADFAAYAQMAPVTEQLENSSNARYMRNELSVLESLGDVAYFAYLNFGEGCIEATYKVYTEEGKNSLKFILDLIFDQVGEMINF